MDKDIDYGELFGVSPDGKDIDTTETDGEGTDGVKEQVVAEPDALDDDNDADDNAVSGDVTDEKSDGESADKNAPKKDGGKNAAFAAARRKAEAERDAAIENAKKEAAAEADRVISDALVNMGMTNPYTKEPIKTKAEYDKYKSEFEARRKEAFRRKTGMSDDDYKAFVAELPEVREAREKAEAAEAAAARAKCDEQLRAINELDPAIKTLDDLTRMDNYDEFYGYVKRGNDFLSAYKLANFGKLTSRAAEKSRQAAVNSTATKAHLEKTSPRGSVLADVPADVRELYKALNPKASEAEIVRHYNKSLKY